MPSQTLFVCTLVRLCRVNPGLSMQEEVLTGEAAPLADSCQSLATLCGSSQNLRFVMYSAPCLLTLTCHEHFHTLFRIMISTGGHCVTQRAFENQQLLVFKNNITQEFWFYCFYLFIYIYFYDYFNSDFKF